jgi:hypothetical protein
MWVYSTVVCYCVDFTACRIGTGPFGFTVLPQKTASIYHRHNACGMMQAEYPELDQEHEPQNPKYLEAFFLVLETFWTQRAKPGRDMGRLLTNRIIVNNSNKNKNKNTRHGTLSMHCDALHPTVNIICQR